MSRPLSPTAPRNPPAIAALAVTLEVDPAGAAPSVVRLIPSGEFRAVDGRPVDAPAWRLDAALAAPIIAAAQQRQSDYVIDYEHQTLLARENGKPAPAAGWYHNLEWRDDGLYATDVCWTPAAALMIQAQEYRYVSPVFGYDRETGAVRHLACAALVSNPGLDGLTDLGASLERLAAKLFTPLENVSMNETLKKLLAALGLQETATEPEALAAVAALKTHVAALSAQVAQPDPARYVPIAAMTGLQAEHVELQSRLAALSAQAHSAQLEQVIDDGLTAGKLTPALTDWARNLGNKDIAALSAYIAAAPTGVVPGSTQTGGKATTGNAGRLDVTSGPAIAQAALSYQVEQAAAGISITTPQAVAHVIKTNGA